MTHLRWVVWGAALAIAAGLGVGMRGMQGPSAGALTAEAMRADLAAFRAEFFDRDRSYSPAARKAAEEKLAALQGALDRTTTVGFELALARIVALADNGHTMTFAGPRARRFNRVPVRFTPFGEDFRVLRAIDAGLLGARLTAIDGHPIEALRAAARTLAGGVPEWRDRSAGFLFESPEQLHALGLAAGPDRATYAFETIDGRRLDRVLAADPPKADVPAGTAARWLYPEPASAAPGAWRAILSPDRTPWWLLEPDSPFRSRALPDVRALVIQLRQTNDAGGHPIRQFLQEMTAKIKADTPQHLVVDLRLNGGGDLNNTREFMKSLPSLVPGRIFVLTNAWTFSAAISTAGYLKQAAPTRVTIAGEPVGDRLNFFAEGRPAFLPNSGVGLLPATERHDYQTGCRGFSDCHGPVVRNPIAMPTLAPDLPVPLTIDAYRAGADPVMDKVVAALRAPR